VLETVSSARCSLGLCDSVTITGWKGIGHPLYERVDTFSGSFFCLKLDELYLERAWDGSVSESGGMCLRELRVKVALASRKRFTCTVIRTNSPSQPEKSRSSTENPLQLLSAARCIEGRVKYNGRLDADRCCGSVSSKLLFCPRHRAGGESCVSRVLLHRTSRPPKIHPSPCCRLQQSGAFCRPGCLNLLKPIHSPLQNPPISYISMNR